MFSGAQEYMNEQRYGGGESPSCPEALVAPDTLTTIAPKRRAPTPTRGSLLVNAGEWASP